MENNSLVDLHLQKHSNTYTHTAEFSKFTNIEKIHFRNELIIANI